MTDSAPPLVVDLDETLVAIDTLRLLRQRLAVHRPWLLRKRARAFAQGKQHEKLWLWRSVPLAIERLPLNEPLLDHLRSCTGARQLVLATGSSHELASAVRDRVGLFDAVVGTDPSVNLTGPRKAARLLELYGHEGFDYIGDSVADLEVWRHARRAYVCTSDTDLVAQVAALHPTCEVVAPQPHNARAQLMLVAAPVTR